MSDDESFVVLGQSPFSSLKNEVPILEKDNEIISTIDEKYTPAKDQSITTERNSISDSMAASFILGDLKDPQVMIESVKSQYPSLMESLKSNEEVAKLQSLISSNMEMKETLRKTNNTMGEWILKTKQTMDNYQVQIHSCREETAKLRNENKMLKDQLDEKIRHIETMEQIRTQENEQLRMGISEKSSQIMNMQQQIIKLESQQLQSYDLLMENQAASLQKEYVPIQEHNTTVKEFERKMSELVAENLEIKGMQKVYIDEINCLKVNLTSLEELYNKAKGDINILQSVDNNKNKEFTEYQKKIKDLEDEMAILRIQVDTYQKDFETERNARQTMAGERDNLLVELKKLQVSNQKLIEEAEQNLTKIKNSPSNSSPAKPKFTNPIKENQIYERVVYSCPLCGIEQKTLGALQNHVQACLEENQ